MNHLVFARYQHMSKIPMITKVYTKSLPCKEPENIPEALQPAVHILVHPTMSLHTVTWKINTQSTTATIPNQGM